MAVVLWGCQNTSLLVWTGNARPLEKKHLEEKNVSGLEMDLKGQCDLTLMPLMTVSAKLLCFAQVLSGEEAEVLTCKAERDSETIRICRLWQPHPLHDSLTLVKHLK